MNIASVIRVFLDSSLPFTFFLGVFLHTARGMNWISSPWLTKMKFKEKFDSFKEILASRSMIFRIAFVFDERSEWRKCCDEKEIAGLVPVGDLFSF